MNKFAKHALRVLVGIFAVVVGSAIYFSTVHVLAMKLATATVPEWVSQIVDIASNILTVLAILIFIPFVIMIFWGIGGTLLDMLSSDE